MRLAALLTVALLASPAHAWEAGMQDGLCTLSHDEADVSVLITFDPAGPLYSFSIVRGAPWPDAANFGIRFLGPRAGMIVTDRHVLDVGGLRLSVTDTGFGNVLAGLEFNQIAEAMIGREVVAIPLDDAAPAVAAFRSCIEAPMT
ncbi:MAG: hypothetical protein AAF914_04805 [Pseudomonadota bacterium]